MSTPPPLHPLRSPRLSPQPQDSDSILDTQQQHILQFKKQTQITRQRILQLIQDNKYTLQIKNMVERGMVLMDQADIHRAGIVFAQCEKVLEYAANMGKSISRELIMSVLHNLACCHQQTWNLQKCSTYVQALIYNLNCELNTTTKSLQLAQTASNKRSLASYYLLFCAINSQLKLNDAALISARKAHQLLKTSSLDLSLLSLKTKSLPQSWLTILKQMSRMPSTVYKLQTPTLRQSVCYLMSVWKNRCGFPNQHLSVAIQRFKNYSIGNVMQMEMIKPNKMAQNGWIQLTQQRIIERAVLLSISYFTMATQLRLLASKQADTIAQLCNSRQYIESQCFHLLSVVVMLHFVPFDMLYLQHIISSYQNHYNKQLVPCHTSQHTPQQLMDMIMDPESSISENSHGQASKQNSHLHSYVKASLHQAHQQYNKLTNYYYVRQEPSSKVQQIQPFPSKMIKTSSNALFPKSKSKKNKSKSKSKGLKRACLTSYHSTQKTPIGYSPANRSPSQHSPKHRSTLAAKSDIQPARKIKQNYYLDRPQPRVSEFDKSRFRPSAAVEQYFNTDYELKGKTNRVKNGSKSKGGHSKENKGLVSSHGLRAVAVGSGRSRSKEKGNGLKGLRSPGKGKSKIVMRH